MFGCPMGSPVSMVLANLVMESVESRILSNPSFDVLYWRRFVDDTWVVLPEPNVNNFLSFINGIEPSINFTVERENDCSLSFLDIFIKRSCDFSFHVSLYHKPYNSNQVLSFSSYNPLCHKRAVVKCLTKRANVICSDVNSRPEQLETAHDILKLNGYPSNFVYHNSYHDVIRSDRLINKKICIPYVDKVSESLCKLLSRYDIGVYHQPICKVKDFFRLPKDEVDVHLKTGVVYSIPCGDCDKTYIGQTGNSFSTRLNQHKSALRLLHPEKSALAEHAITKDHQINWDMANIICQEKNYKKRLFLEAWHSNKNNCLNRCELFIPSIYSNV